MKLKLMKDKEKMELLKLTPQHKEFIVIQLIKNMVLKNVSINHLQQAPFTT